ncbi:MAG TPA: flippase activity-associated protein Agl23 [Armatimonadota bacterium]|nr:flippase activity-associated protein Agl23 [Armatimonadota bacterium]
MSDRVPGDRVWMRRGLFPAAFLLVVIGALLFRTPDIGNRPMHGDEAVHAFKFRELWKKGLYRYDPNEYHGPTLYYATLPSVYLRGRSDFAQTRESDYRIVIAVFGAGLVLILWLLSDGLGPPATLWAALLTAVSPAFVFYSRYYIQETLLAFFTLAAIACGWRYTRRRSRAWAAALGLSVGLMAATKETFVLAAAAAVVGLGAVAWSRRRKRERLTHLWNGKAAALAIAAALLIACLFLSGFMTNPVGPLDLLRSYTPWITRAHATNLHRHPWFYYLRILGWSRQPPGPVWSEGIILLLSAFGAAGALFGPEKWIGSANRSLVRFLGFYTLALTIIYSVIPYKTPWCVLSFLDGMILLAGMGAAMLVRLAPAGAARVMVVVLLLAGAGQLAGQAYRASYVYTTAGGNPYVYAQPSPDVANLARHIETISRAWPQRHQMVVKVISVNDYYWPLPWYLREFPNVGYWTTMPRDPSAPVVIASPEFDDALTRKIGATHLMTGYFGLRPSVLLEVWVRMDVWKAYIEQKRRRAT